MKVHIIKPSLCLDMSDEINEFYDVMIEELETYLPVVRVNSHSTLLNTEFSDSDSVIIFNNPDQIYSSQVRSFLKNAKSLLDDTSFFSVATCKDSRYPCEIIGESQSYDLIDQLKVRCLTEENINLIALDFARYIISTMQPTLTNNEMNIFISHKRKDGEDKARSIYENLQKRAGIMAYRDLIEVRAGEEAQKSIEANLALSDFVLFLDTPEAGDSIWIEKELRLAIEQNIPILWLRDGDEFNRKKLRLKPFDQPHIKVNVEDLNDDEFQLFIEEIIDIGFSLVRKQSEKALEYLAELNRLSSENLIKLEWQNRNSMVATINLPRPKSRYDERPIEHRIQIFGRSIKADDQKNFMATHHLPNLDTSLLLTASKSSYMKIQDRVLIDSLDDYLGYIERTLKPRVSKQKVIILSGAFPDCEPEFQYVLNNALKSISESIITEGYTLSFGAHPTFKHLVFQSQNLYASKDKNAVKMYVSKYFVTEALIQEDAKKITVVSIDAKPSREESLTLLRESMIGDVEAVALIALGGKTSAGGHNPGIDEEIEIARKYGVPVFLIGSVGGRSSELSKECIDQGSFSELNSYDYEFNRRIAKETRYKTAIREIMKKLN